LTPPDGAQVCNIEALSITARYQAKELRNGGGINALRQLRSLVAGFPIGRLNKPKNQILAVTTVAPAVVLLPHLGAVGSRFGLFLALPHRAGRQAIVSGYSVTFRAPVKPARSRW
jgi:hypothetical protein